MSSAEDTARGEPVGEEAEAVPALWVSALQRWAASVSYLGAVYVFGSRARGEHRPDSDLDVAYVIDRQVRDRPSMAPLSDWESTLRRDIPVKVDLWSTEHDRGEERVWPGVVADGIVVVDRLRPPGAPRRSFVA